jgi:ribosomal protein S18 acetylase RimI-like enzyme
MANPVSPIVICDFEAGSALALVRMWRESFEYGVGIVDPHPIEEQLAFFEDKILPNYRVRVARCGKEIVGFVAADAESISQLYVRVASIGQGIGSRLLTLAQEESFGKLWLHTFARNKLARHFYAGRGFREVQHGFEESWQLADVRLEWERRGDATHPRPGNGSPLDRANEFSRR